MEAAGARSRKRRAPASEETQRPMAGADEDDGGGVDRISALPDALLGEIITLLPTKDGARTQILSPRWRHLWSSAPLNLDHRDINKHGERLNQVVSRVLSTHSGPGRRFCVYVGVRHAALLDGWLRSPALDNLQELELDLYGGYSASVFRFSSTLRVAHFEQCRIPDLTVQGLHLSVLQQLELKNVTISECSLHSLIGGCPVLESLMLRYCLGFRCFRIDSLTLRAFVCHDYRRANGENSVQLNELIIHNAPCLQRVILYADSGIPVLVGAAPNLEMVGIANSCYPDTDTFGFRSTVIQGLPSDKLPMVVRTVKILRVDITPLSLDKAIEFITCFPSLEKLYIQAHDRTGPSNCWRRKHQDLVKCIDLSLKTIVLELSHGFRGVKWQVNFVTFFVLNARVLELMTLFVDSSHYNKEFLESTQFLEEQRRKLQLDKRASRGARFHFTTERCLPCSLGLKYVDDLETDPFLM